MIYTLSGRKLKLDFLSSLLQIKVIVFSYSVDTLLTNCVHRALVPQLLFSRVLMLTVPSKTESESEAALSKVISQDTMTAVMSKYLSDTRPNRINSWYQLRNFLQLKKKKKSFKRYSRSLEVLRNKLQAVMAFQTYAYYVNHYAVNKSNSILSKFMDGLTHLCKIKICTNYNAHLFQVCLLFICLFNLDNVSYRHKNTLNLLILKSKGQMPK